MNDTPGWTSPGSAPSDGQEPGASGPADRPATGEPADRPNAEPTSPGTKWSKEQPPPGQWSAPTGPGQTPPPPPPHTGWGTPPPPPGGYGGQGRGYAGPGGYGWGGPPPAAKPGVIPLRPLGVGEILDGAVSTMRTYWRTVLGISLTVAIFTEIIVVLLQGLVLDNTSSDALNDPDATLSELADALTATTVNSGVIFLISLIGTVIATALLTTVTSRAVLGRPVTTREAWRDARPQVIKLFGLIVLLLLMVAGILLVAMLPGLLVTATAGGEGGVALTALGFLAGALVAVWLMVRFSLASPALMLEKQGIKKAMGRSTKLVNGSWWRVFGIQLLATVIANIVASIIVIPFTFLAATLSGDGVSGFLEGGGDLGWTFLVVSGVGSVIGSMITFPITAGVTVLLYIDQRIRREALDLELARAAGVQGPGSPGAVPGS
ncbi:glycerophosphoryl diester phosphodiesterase membrane domain-containing protein [Streptomyces sp. CL12-4]|uniref:glycerophosphoryl diester phosphodiesterase membrane domain-containing protein n=1 Tax=Streptomyces sp. CL12-4 TaxID=2810306 RepID=UPI001EFBE69B|nr:glycerophosphoryl diester phosphodiesterase membrane domain-containing protein [Streptomyces sp. CL12-4]MCG8967235.1 glycerophosphoryl diester phosphodiesterase membrane domain-containing protein [Streptomyces sp. CL12-4]